MQGRLVTVSLTWQFQPSRLGESDEKILGGRNPQFAKKFATAASENRAFLGNEKRVAMYQLTDN